MHEVVGYARVSTDDQNLTLQKDALEKAGCTKFFTDTISGSKSSRPGLDELLKYSREGDTVVVWRLDRLGRSLKDLIEIVGKLEVNGIALKSLNESIDTSSSSGKLIFHIFGALAEFERNLIRERTNAGLESAKARGRVGGRPKKLEPKKIDIAKELYKSNEHSVIEICDLVGVSKPTLYKYLKTNKTEYLKNANLSNKAKYCY